VIIIFATGKDGPVGFAFALNLSSAINHQLTAKNVKTEPVFAARIFYQVSGNRFLKLMTNLALSWRELQSMGMGKCHLPSRVHVLLSGLPL
jgi:hypothetical protein